MYKERAKESTKIYKTRQFGEVGLQDCMRCVIYCLLYVSLVMCIFVCLCIYTSIKKE